MIEVEDVGVELGGRPVLDGADLAVDSGELVGLVGPNGAGKTTLLRTVNGLLEPDRGRVCVDGDRIDRLGSRAVSRRVATVPQDAHLGFTFTVEEIVEMGRTPHRSRLDWSEAGDAVGDALARTGIEHLRERPIDEVSGGERQRVLVARALAQEAPVLVLDEPTASLDVNHQVQVMELVRGLVEDGRTALAAIHDLDLAARYCDRLALLAGGSIRRAGDPMAVLDSTALGEAFETTAAVTENHLTATPTVTALANRPARDRRIHVVGTGPAAARALGACWRAGFDVSVGPVPAGSSAASLAESVDARAATAAPFEPVGSTEGIEALLAAADAVVLTTPDPDPATADLLADADRVVEWEGGRATDLPGTLDGDRAPQGGDRAAAVVDAVVAALSGGDD